VIPTSIQASDAASHRRETAWRCLGLFATALITFVLVRIAVLNVFYTTGDMHDPGWIASVIWHNRWRLPGPPGFSGPYFAEHLSPMLGLINAISYVIPLPKFDYYAACIAASHALYAAGVYRAWQLSDARVTAARMVVAILVALAAAFSGVAVVALRQPHPELAIPALALWFVMAMARRTYVWAAFWLAACLMVREDAGLHVFALLTLWVGVIMWRQRGIARDTRWLAGFALAAFGYSVAAFLAKGLAFPADDVFTRSYPGIPAWHHVTVPFIVDRLRFYAHERSYVVLPLLLTFVWAAISRNPLLPLGYAAALPWLLLSILALHPTAGGLGFYYGFPFWLSLAWPLVALRLWTETTGRPCWRWPYALPLLFSVIGWQLGHLTIYPLERNYLGESPFVYQDTLRERSRYQDFIDYFLTNRPLFGTIALDEAVSGLLIDHVDRTVWLDNWRTPPETMIYFPGAYDWVPHVLPLLHTGAYRCIYEVPGTRIHMATQDPVGGSMPVPMPFMLVSGSIGAGC
jgi:hypothetical protein